MEKAKTGGEMLPPRPKTNQKSLPATVELFDGRKVIVNRFQPFQFLEAANEAQKHRNKRKTTQAEVTQNLLCSICTFEGGDMVTKAALVKMLKADINELQSWVQSPLTVTEKTPHPEFFQTQKGILPSGKKFELHFPNGQTDIDAELMAGPENTMYSLVALCVKIDGENVDWMTVQLMDGQDFMALFERLNETPS